jgi:putative DNA primase/helicase
MTKFPSDSDDAPDNVADFNSRALAKKARERPAVSGDALVTEDSAARRFADLYNDQLRYCHSTGAWFEWNGQRWSQNQLGKAFHFARELARKMVESEPDKVRFIASKASFAGSVERYARQDPIFAVTANYWDRNPMLVGTPVGTVDLKTGVLRPGDPADGITKSTAVAPAETSDCPLWRRFIFEVCGADEGMVRFLQQWFGYSLTGDTREQMLVFIHGGGGNGKGVVVNTIKGIVGDYAATPTMESLTASKNDRHSTDFAMLRGARVACASETEKGRAWAESKIKQLTGGDDVTARFLYKNNFTFRPTFKLLIIGNDKPRLNNVGAAERRRYIIVPFNFKPEVPDKQLEEKLKAEWPAILRWMIEGCLDWQNNGLIRPQSVKDETEKYFSDQDLWAQWLEDDCDLEPENRYKMAGTGELFNSWSNYAKASGVDAGNNVDFASRLEREGCVRTREGKDRKRIWRGIEVRRDQSDNRYRD